MTMTADDRGERRQPARRDQRAHLALVGGEHHQRHDGEGKLQATGPPGDRISSLRRALRAIPDGDDRRRNDGDGAGDQPPQPRRQANIEEALHHDLAGQRRRDGGVQPAAQQRDAEQRRRDGRAEQRRQEANAPRSSSATSVWPVLWKVAAARIRIEALIEQREHQRDGRIDGGELDRLALLRHACGHRRASARCRNADRGYAASPSRR